MPILKKHQNQKNSDNGRKGSQDSSMQVSANMQDDLDRKPLQNKHVQKEPSLVDENPLKFDETIKVDIRNRKEQFFDGEAKTVSSLNDTGEFDVLPQHANFVTLIKGYVIVDKKLPTEKKFEIENGVLAAKTGAVDVYLDF
jgi:hypothetical protein